MLAIIYFSRGPDCPHRLFLLLVASLLSLLYVVRSLSSPWWPGVLFFMCPKWLLCATHFNISPYEALISGLFRLTRRLRICVLGMDIPLYHCQCSFPDQPKRCPRGRGDEEDQLLTSRLIELIVES